MIAMDDVGFIVGSYVLTFAVIAGLAWRVLIRGRAVSAEVDDADKYWT